MDSLTGRRILALRRSDDARDLCFVTESGPIGFAAWGDCCSESWFNHIEGVSVLVGATVARVETIPETKTEGTRQECDRVYGWRIHTDRGTASIEMRNSSNGYYGGEADESDGAVERATISVGEDF